MIDFTLFPLIQEPPEDSITPFMEVTPSIKRGKTISEISNRVLPVENQGTYPTCVGVSGKKLAEKYLNMSDLSAMFIYRQAKLLDEFKGESYNGTSILGAILALRDYGVCLQKYFPYTLDSFVGIVDNQALEKALENKLNTFARVMHTLDTVKELLLTNIIWSTIPVHKKLYSPDENGIIASNYTDSDVLGYHAILLTGFKTINGSLYMELQNSWGTTYGKDGFCYIEANEFIKFVKNMYCNDKSVTSKEPFFIIKIVKIIATFLRNLISRK